MRRFSAIILALAMLWGAAAASTASADTLTVVMRNNNYDTIEVEFYSKSRNVVWPGDGEVYKLAVGRDHSMRLLCRSGERICYGAWTSGDRQGSYWGVGPAAKYGCRVCCYTCNGGTTAVVDIHQ